MFRNVLGIARGFASGPDLDALEPYNRIYRGLSSKGTILFRGNDGQMFYGPRLRNQCGKGEFITFTIINDH